MFRQFATLVFALGLATSVGCAVPYPRCNNDNDCRGHKEVCVQGQCQQCRADSDCTTGQRCSNNRCLNPGACEGPSDCGRDENCVARRCQPKLECDDTRPCSDGRHCTEGRCLTDDEDDPSRRDNRGQACTFEPVYFAFDSSTLDPASTRALEASADCLRKEQTSRYVLIGRADPRGTTEYNLALGERRARAVQRYLVTLGVTEERVIVSSEGSEAAVGTDEATWVKDRRVDFRPRD